MTPEEQQSYLEMKLRQTEKTLETLGKQSKDTQAYLDALDQKIGAVGRVFCQGQRCGHRSQRRHPEGRGHGFARRCQQKHPRQQNSEGEQQAEGPVPESQRRCVVGLGGHKNLLEKAQMLRGKTPRSICGSAIQGRLVKAGVQPL